MHYCVGLMLGAGSTKLCFIAAVNTPHSLRVAGAVQRAQEWEVMVSLSLICRGQRANEGAKGLMIPPRINTIYHGVFSRRPC